MLLWTWKLSTSVLLGIGIGTMPSISCFVLKPTCWLTVVILSRIFHLAPWCSVVLCAAKSYSWNGIFWKQLSGTGRAIVMRFGRKVKSLEFLEIHTRSRVVGLVPVQGCQVVDVSTTAFKFHSQHFSIYLQTFLCAFAYACKHRAKKFTNKRLIWETIIPMIVELDGSCCGRCYLAVATVVLCCWQYHLWSLWDSLSGFRELRGDPSLFLSWKWSVKLSGNSFLLKNADVSIHWNLDALWEDSRFCTFLKEVSTGNGL